MPDAERELKSAVDYGPGHLDREHCGRCEHYYGGSGPMVGIGLCRRVIGAINTQMWCRLFEARRD